MSAETESRLSSRVNERVCIRFNGPKQVSGRFLSVRDFYEETFQRLKERNEHFFFSFEILASIH